MWKKFELAKIEAGKEYLFYNEEYKDEDCTNGVRIGHLKVETRAFGIEIKKILLAFFDGGAFYFDAGQIPENYMEMAEIALPIPPQDCVADVNCSFMLDKEPATKTVLNKRDFVRLTDKKGRRVLVKVSEIKQLSEDSCSIQIDMGGITVPSHFKKADNKETLERLIEALPNL